MDGKNIMLHSPFNQGDNIRNHASSSSQMAFWWFDGFKWLVVGIRLEGDCSSLFWTYYRPLDSRKRTTTSTRFDLKFFPVLSKYRHPGILYCYFFSPGKLALLSLLTEVELVVVLFLESKGLYYWCVSNVRLNPSTVLSTFEGEQLAKIRQRGGSLSAAPSPPPLPSEIIGSSCWVYGKAI